MTLQNRRNGLLFTIAAMVALSAATARASLYQTAVLADNPLAYFNFNELAGPTATNLGSEGAAANATYNNVNLGLATPLVGLGTAAGFNGSNSNVRVPDVAAFNVGTGAFTVELWYATNTAARGDLFTYKGTGGDYGLVSNRVAPPAGSTGLVSTHFNATNGEVGANIGWRHLVATRGAGGAYNMYIDGALAFAGTDADTWNIANDILIGSNHNGNPSTIAIPFNGIIDEVAIYNTELSAARVAAHYAAAFADGLTSDAPQSIGVNFVGGGGPGNAQVRTLQPFEVAGVVPQAFWNNATGADGTLTNLTNSLGLPSAATITYDGDALFSTGNGSGSSNHILMNGYVDDTQGGDPDNTSTYTVSNIPFARYNVIVYTDSSGTEGRDESFTLINNLLEDFGTIFVSDEANFSGAFVRATATSQDGPGAQGNYVLFEGVTGSEFTLFGHGFDFVSGATMIRRNFVNAIQIIDAHIPEPGTVALGLLSLAGLGLRRRRIA